MEKQFYTVKELSQACNISIRTLTYYEDIGLLKPAKKDEFGGYDYYSKEQIPLVYIIAQFQIQGLSLEAIKTALIHNEFQLQKDELQRKKHECKGMIDQMIHLEQRFSQYLDALQYGDGDIHLQIKQLPKQRVAYVRKCAVITSEELHDAMKELQDILEHYALRPTGTTMAISYENQQDIIREESDMELCVPVSFPIDLPDVIHTIEGKEVLCAIHYGPYENEAETYAIMMQWILDHEYQWSAQPMKRYLVDAHLSDQPEDYITELMIPIRKP